LFIDIRTTDIFDKELNELRRARWEKAFSENATKDNDALRATIVIEHIMQASDVCHTMQHWHIYRKWNRRLFIEMLQAYRAGRMGADPATFWYKGELGFFDNYIIPLSKKLKEYVKTLKKVLLSVLNLLEIQLHNIVLLLPTK